MPSTGRLTLAVLAPFLYLLACSGPPAALQYSVEVPVESDSARVLQEELRRALDSLQGVEPCRRVWRAARGDSVWVCPDPQPPAPR